MSGDPGSRGVSKMFEVDDDGFERSRDAQEPFSYTDV